MAAAIRHRGPDDTGYWSDGRVALGFVRLSILDLAGGRQPMSNGPQGWVHVVYNGEIYNHVALRRELEAAGHRFHTDHSDTEVLVHGWLEWGEGLPARLNGMFAFALWDARRNCLFLARDRHGVKPLYVASAPGGSVLFASEIRALHASGLLERQPDPGSIVEYFTQQNVWGERTFFSGVSLFPAAHHERIVQGERIRTRYWDYAFRRRGTVPIAEAAVEHRVILQRAVERHVAADVPVASYLSGGIDSTAVCAMAARLDPAMRAYTCIFDVAGAGEDRIVDEREDARAVARALGIRHVELELPQDALVAALRPTIRALEDPRMGPSYENYLIAGRAARDGKVVLSGAGGDELHGGYVGRYQALMQAGRRGGVRGFLERWTQAPRRRQEEKLLELVNYPVPEAALRDAFTPEFVAQAGGAPVQERLTRLLAGCASDDIRDRLMYVDARTYLHGLLVMEDKLSMAHSLESRVPLLDNELIDFVSTLPWECLADASIGKKVFRESVRPVVPDSIYRKPKMGFGPPEASWYRGALRPFVEQTLSASRIGQRGIFKPQYVARVLGEHFSGARNHAAAIWSLLSLEAWCAEFGLLGGALAAGR